jgi:hypothetical protein
VIIGRAEWCRCLCSAPRLGRNGNTNLWRVIIGSAIVVIGGLVFAISRAFVDPTHLAQKSPGVLIGLAAVVIVIAIALYWLMVSQVFAALRLLTTRVPPDNTPLPTVLASPLPPEDTGDPITRYKKRSLAAGPGGNYKPPAAHD